MSNYLEDIKEAKSYMVSYILSFLIIAFTLFAVGISKAEVLGLHFYLPVISSKSIAVMFFEMIRTELVPTGVRLIATSPSSAFVSQTIISIIGSFIITFPYLVYRIFQFLSPALYSKEKRKAFKILLPASILFLGGVAFSYFFLIPPTFKVLYSFNTNLDVEPFFAVSEFISWTLSIMFFTGVMFLLPVFMYILSWLNFISSEVWLKHWKIALAIFLVTSAIITPDGSGVTMMILFFPMMIFYIVGAVFSRRRNGRLIDNKNSYA